MRVSYSQIGAFEQCPYKWYLNYVEKMETIIEKQPSDALILGNALHKGLETRSINEAIKYYRENMNVGSDQCVHEEMKLRAMVAKGLECVPDGLHETALEIPREFKGFIDLLVPVDDLSIEDKDVICADCEYYDNCNYAESGSCNRGKYNRVFDMYDYKYANAKSADKYRESGQLSVYNYYFERLGKGKIRNMYFVLFPKVAIRQKKTETLDGFRRRLRDELSTKEPEFIQVEYQPEKVKEFLRGKKALESAANYPKQPSRLCDWCDYQTFCEKGEMTMMLPKAERVNRAKQGKIKLWIYGEPFSGKTTFANGAPMPLMLNTDGNVKFIDAPSVAIKDTLETEGRMTKKVFGWQTFKDTIAELEKDAQGFETVVVDLVEGVYELCRTYMYDKRGWEHESDDSFKAWDIVRKEFLDTMRKLTNLDLNVILISHEDSSRDFTRPAGNKVTALKPNIADKVAKQLAGMVDVVGRVVVRDGSHLLTFKTDETVFGGGRLTMTKTEIPLDWETFEGVYRDKTQIEKAPESPQQQETKDEAPKPKARKPRAKKEPEEVIKVSTEPATAADEVPFDEEPQEKPAEEQPKRRVRKKRTVEE